MCKHCKNKNQVYLVLDKMSTKDLESIVHYDFLFFNDESEEDGTILFYILDILVQRKKRHRSELFHDVEKSWKRFIEKYPHFFT